MTLSWSYFFVEQPSRKGEKSLRANKVWLEAKVLRSKVQHTLQMLGTLQSLFLLKKTLVLFMMKVGDKILWFEKYVISWKFWSSKRI